MTWAKRKKSGEYPEGGAETPLDEDTTVDPVRRALEAAPLDDEPLSPEEEAAIEEGEAEKGPSLSLPAVREMLSRRRHKA